MRGTATEVARALLTIEAIGLSGDTPVTFKSGIKAPLYIDNRKLVFHPEHWRTIIVGFQKVLEAQGTIFDVVAGIETGGIPHSSALAYTMRRPSVWVRKQAKDHGLQRRVEGGDVTGKRVLLLEDQVTTGGSSLSGVMALRDAGAIVEDCVAITSYGFKEAIEAFTEAGVRLHTLTTFPVILETAGEIGIFNARQIETIQAWLGDPRGWSEQH
ncbi:MAG TPA: orotate phosphoribosyltransferase [Phototrophicaceae bacterium]|nr:orotate phosphoribosyltransferase [Phototrophicaceae bacterium]